jgi:hypothetical protein
MRRRLSWCIAAAGLALAAEPALSVAGHWPLGTGAVLGVGGSLLLVLAAKALARAGLQRSKGEPEHDGA